MPIRLRQDEFADLVEQALASLPASFQPYIENLIVDIQPAPTPKQLADLGLRRGDRLMGLYQGVPLTEKSSRDTVDWPEQVIIFQRDVEAVCRTRREIVEQVRRTVLHEVGHHFGLDEGDLEDLGYG